MSTKKRIDKDRLYFTQCNDPIYLRCPKCTQTKIPRQCKAFKKFLSLYLHLLGHIDIAPAEMKEFIESLRWIHKALKWNMFPQWK